MSDPMYFRSVMQTPPGGEWFFEHGGERVSDTSWPRFLPKLLDIMRRHKLTGAPRDVAAAYMCPHMPDWFCTAGGVKVTGADSARKAAQPYFSKHLVPYNVMIQRLAKCRECPRHSRSVCLTCTGILDWIGRSFGSRRTSLPDDRLSGICTCAGTFESVITSVDSKELPEWSDVPECCWRKETT